MLVEKVSNITTAQFKKFLEILKMSYSYQEMKHGIRINGVIDLYKNRKTVYCLRKNSYEYFTEIGEMENFVITYLKEVKPKKIESKVSYKTFTKMMCEANTSKRYAEDYHWDNNLEEKSEDHLYFIIYGDKVKIGRSKDVVQRINTLKTSFSSDDFTVYVFENKGCLEKIIHKCFEDFRAEREWFKNDVRFASFVLKRINGDTNYKLSFQSQS